MNCPNCNTPKIEGALFCRECGYKFEEQEPVEVASAETAFEETQPAEVVCPVCGKVLTPEMLFCNECGAPVAKTLDEEPVPVPQPVAPATAEPAPAPRRKSSGCLGAFFSVLLSIIIFVVAIPAMLIGEVRMMFSSGGLENTINAISLEDIIIETEEGIKTSVVDYAADFVDELVGEEINVRTQDIQEFLEESTLVPFVSEKLAAVADVVFTGEIESIITKDDALKLLEENSKLLEEYGVELNQEAREELVEMLEEEGTFDMLSTEKLFPDAEPALEIVREVMSYKTLGSLALVILFLGLIIMLINWWDKSAALSYVGVTFIILGIIFTIPGIIAMAASDVILGLLAGMEYVGVIVSAVLKANLVVPVGVLVLGIVFVVIRAIVKSVIDKKAARV